MLPEGRRIILNSECKTCLQIQPTNNLRSTEQNDPFIVGPEENFC